MAVDLHNEFLGADSFVSKAEHDFRAAGGVLPFDSLDTLALTEEEYIGLDYSGEPEVDASADANPYPFIRGLVDVRGQLQRNGNGGPWTKRALSQKTGGAMYHYAGPAQNRSISALDRIKSYASYHCRLNGFGAGATGNGLMYHIAIAEDGTKYLCFDIEYDRWHCGAWPWNGTALAINIPIGEGQTPTEAQYRAAREVGDDWLKARGQARSQIRGHKEVGASACPGLIIMNGLVLPMRQGKNPGGGTAPTPTPTPPKDDPNAPGFYPIVRYNVLAYGPRDRRIAAAFVDAFRLVASDSKDTLVRAVYDPQKISYGSNRSYDSPAGKDKIFAIVTGGPTVGYLPSRSRDLLDLEDRTLERSGHQNCTGETLEKTAEEVLEVLKAACRREGLDAEKASAEFKDILNEEFGLFGDPKEDPGTPPKEDPPSDFFPKQGRVDVKDLSRVVETSPVAVVVTSEGKDIGLYLNRKYVETYGTQYPPLDGPEDPEPPKPEPPKDQPESDPLPKGTRWGVTGGTLISPFNQFRPKAPAQQYHKGEDIGAAVGAPVYAVTDGEVIRSRNGGVDGYHQEITIAYDVRGISQYVDTIYVLYGHVLKDSILPVGRKVSRGQLVAKCGTSADAMDTAPHVHVQMWVSRSAALAYNNALAQDPEPIRAAMEPTLINRGNPSTPQPSTPRGVYDFVGAPRYSESEMKSFFQSIGVTSEGLQAIPEYYKHYDLALEKNGRALAPDALLLQSVHETGLMKWFGASRKWQMAGVKKAGDQGDSFENFEPCPDLERGVAVHANYMSVWCGVGTFGYVPPRAERDLPSVVRAKGPIATFNDIGGHAGKYAADPGYREHLKRYADKAEAHVKARRQSTEDVLEEARIDVADTSPVVTLTLDDLPTRTF